MLLPQIQSFVKGFLLIFYLWRNLNSFTRGFFTNSIEKIMIFLTFTGITSELPPRITSIIHLGVPSGILPESHPRLRPEILTENARESLFWIDPRISSDI